MKVESRVSVDRDYLLAVSSYGVTLLRLLIAVGGAVTILRGQDIRLGVASILLVMALDYFDGATFERSNLSGIMEWRIGRRIVDSISDRLVIQIVCIPVLITDSSFSWLYLLIAAREMAISGYISRQFAQGRLVYPRGISKIACAMIGLAVISSLVFSFTVTVMTAATMIALSAFALFEYIRRTQNFKASRPIAPSNGSLAEIF